MTTLATDIKLFQGISAKYRGPKISHLFFADDSMFFFKPTTEACSAIATLISRFCHISGQMLNLQKSYIKFSPNIDQPTQQTYKDLLRMGSHTSLGIYLGTPIDIQGTKMQHFTPLLDKISTKIST